ncbi:hypothetical protein BC937DRAFT_86128 [Endogone sp. FLAS-F59071]|nr:hypothetical protein BC937DRAFT_86128 [Endogone sp. FLAS-F59071]|eukprot:RUS23444.1 hypothetical protein BC937DRAFT_86128 [Endogone sp. FLAS-F59071]
MLSHLSVKVFDASTNALVSEILRANVIEIGFSPRGTYISTWERPTKLEDGSGSKNLTVWEARSGNELASFSQKGQSNWNLQWNESEEYCARMVTGEVHFWESKNIGKATWTKLRLEGISEFSLSPGKNPSVAVFIPEIKGAPAIVRMFGIPNFNTPLSNKTFYKADKVDMIWNNSGGNLLVVTHTEVDKTGKSYYGETNLYHMSVTGNIDRVALGKYPLENIGLSETTRKLLPIEILFFCSKFLDKEGPIHDVTWSPNSKEFVVVYGSMPAQATLFDHRINAVKDFGLNPRNFVRFNPQGRILCIAGFGNLNGTVDMWDLKTQKKITTFQASNASYCDWSPDGRYLMTATLTPRLRVDNGYKVWHYQGTLVYWEGVDELYQINWRPAPVDLYPMRSALSPAPTPIRSLETTTQEAKPAGSFESGFFIPVD